jgi:hypothetical protein
MKKRKQLQYQKSIAISIKKENKNIQQTIKY